MAEEEWVREGREGKGGKGVTEFEAFEVSLQLQARAATWLALPCDSTLTEEGGGDKERGHRKVGPHAQIPDCWALPSFHLGFQMGVPKARGEMFRQSSAGGGESGPHPAPRPPHAGPRGASHPRVWQLLGVTDVTQ